jgi:hypothetical protein
LKAAARTQSLDLDLHAEGDAAADATIVDRAWIQSWLTTTARQDRAVFQFTTNRKELEVILPADAAMSQAAVLVDGKRVEFQATSENRLLIPLAGQSVERQLTVELRYHFSGPRPPQGEMTLELPQLCSNAWIRRMYWQLVLPTNEHLIVNPGGFTGEFHWSWTDYFWGRQPLLDQEQLENWVGAAPRAPLPERVNLYLFSTLGKVEEAEVRTAARTWIVLWASGAALVAGLLLIYVPASRHPATLFTAGVALIAMGLIAPEPTLLIAQAASLGLMLTLLAGLLERGVSRRYRVVVRKEPSSAPIEASSTRLPRPQPHTGNPSSTKTMAVIQPPPSLGDAER